MSPLFRLLATITFSSQEVSSKVFEMIVWKRHLWIYLSLDCHLVCFSCRRYTPALKQSLSMWSPRRGRWSRTSHRWGNGQNRTRTSARWVLMWRSLSLPFRKKKQNNFWVCAAPENLLFQNSCMLEFRVEMLCQNLSFLATLSLLTVTKVTPVRSKFPTWIKRNHFCKLWAAQGKESLEN